MNILSSHDEMILLVILRLKDNAYGVTVRREISEAAGLDWSLGAVYDHLYRLERQGFVESFLSAPTQERGGRSRRMFRVRKEGVEALAGQKKVRDRLWHGLEKLVPAD